MKLDAAEKQLKRKDQRESKDKDKSKKAIKEKERELLKAKQELQFYKQEMETKGATHTASGGGGQ